MKKKAIGLLSIVAIFGLASCDKEAKDTTPSITETEKPVITTDDTKTSNSTPEVKTYKVEFYDENGTLIKSEDVEEGKTPEFKYEKESSYYAYYIIKWTNKDGEILEALPKASADAKYYANVTKKLSLVDLVYNIENDEPERVKDNLLKSLDDIYSDITKDMPQNYQAPLKLAYDAAILKVVLTDSNIDTIKNVASTMYKKMATIYNSYYDILDATPSNAKALVLDRIDSISNVINEFIPASYKDDLDSEISKVKSEIEKYSENELSSNIDSIFDNYSKQLNELFEAGLKEKLEEYKKVLLSKVDTLVKAYSDKIESDDLKDLLNTYVDSITAVVSKMESLDEAKNMSTVVGINTKAYFENLLKSQFGKYINAASNELSTIVNSAIDKINDQSIKDSLRAYLQREQNKLYDLYDSYNSESFDSFGKTAKEIKDETIEYVNGVVAEVINAKKSAAKEYLTSLITDTLKDVDDTELRTLLTNYLTEQLALIEKIDSLDSLTTTINTSYTNTAKYANEILTQQLTKIKDKAASELNDLLKATITKIDDEDLKTSLNTFIEKEIGAINNTTSITYAKSTIEIVKSDTNKFISDIISQQLKKLKDKAKSEITSFVNSALEYVTDEKTKKEINDFLTSEIALIDDIESLDSAKTTINSVKSDITTFLQDYIAAVLADMKKDAISKLEELKDEALAKLKDDNLKSELNTLYDTEVEKVNAIDDIAAADDTIVEIKEDLESGIKTILKKALKAVKQLIVSDLNALKTALQNSPNSYIPAAMQAKVQAETTSSATSYAFSDFINISDINYYGFGSQWNMVLDNINQSENFYKYLTVGTTAIQDVFKYAIQYYNNDSNERLDYSLPLSSASFSSSYDEENDVLTFNIFVNNSITVPVLGEIKPKITMTYYGDTGLKDTIIYVADDVNLRYKQTDTKYEFACEYAGEYKGVEASRAAYFSIENKDDLTEGHIYEYITVKNNSLVKSCADFYIDDTYVSVVGNKADAITGMDGYINELYKKNEGRLLGYEVKEEKTVLGKKIEFNTLWFNLKDISGIESIKAKDASKVASNKELDLYINGSDTLFKKTKNTLSRKYDIEFRNRYFYSKDEKGNLVENEVLIPLMFIQEENLSDFANDFLDANGIEANVTLNSKVLEKIMNDYDTLIDAFKTNKELNKAEDIKAFINE